jgi:hypothetical protein
MDDELRNAIRTGNLPKVKLLVEGGASIAGTHKSMSALNLAAYLCKTSIVEWLLAEEWASISDADEVGSRAEFTTLMYAAHSTSENFATVQWLLEYGGADITDTTPAGRTLWEVLEKCLAGRTLMERASVNQLTALLRVMVLQSTPPADLVIQMSPQHSHIVKEGTRLRAELPAYLARRRALLAEHTSLIAPLRALVSSYEEPTTTEELWATGLDVQP